MLLLSRCSLSTVERQVSDLFMIDKVFDVTRKSVEKLVQLIMSNVVRLWQYSNPCNPFLVAYHLEMIAVEEAFSRLFTYIYQQLQ